MNLDLMQAKLNEMFEARGLMTRAIYIVGEQIQFDTYTDEITSLQEVIEEVTGKKHTMAFTDLSGRGK